MIIYLGPNKTDNESNSFNIKNGKDAILIECEYNFTKTIPHLDASTVIPPQIYEVGHGGALDSTQPCSSHTVINDITRSINNQQSFSSCDNGPLFQTSIGGRWIRFVGTGGTILSNRYPGRKHCGGFLSGWSNMTLPTVVNTIVNETVCFDSISSEWNLIIGIRVVKCTDFYVYFLPPIPLCNSRYCTM